MEEYSKNNSDLTNLIFNHPFIVFILGLIGGIIVNSASIKEAWTSKMIPSLLVTLFILLILSISFFEIMRPRAVKFQEIKKFLLWLKNEPISNRGRGFMALYSLHVNFLDLIPLPHGNSVSYLL